MNNVTTKEEYFQYKVVDIDDRELENKLNDFGKEGFDVVHFLSTSNPNAYSDSILHRILIRKNIRKTYG